MIKCPHFCIPPFPFNVSKFCITLNPPSDFCLRQKSARLSLLFLEALNNNDSLFNPLIASPTKWSNTLKQLVGDFPANCLSVFDHFVILALKGLRSGITSSINSSLSFPQVSINYISLGLELILIDISVTVFPELSCLTLNHPVLNKIFYCPSLKKINLFVKNIFISSMSQVCSTLLSSLFLVVVFTFL